jgi:hypothetical protein
MQQLQAQNLQNLRNQLRQQEQDQVLSCHLQRCLDLATGSSNNFLLSNDSNSNVDLYSGPNSFDMSSSLMSNDGFDSGSLSGLLPRGNTMPPQRHSAPSLQQQQTPFFQLDQQLQQFQIQHSQSQSNSLMSQLLLAAESMGQQQQQWQAKQSFVQLQQGLGSSSSTTTSNSPLEGKSSQLRSSLSAASLSGVQQDMMMDSSGGRPLSSDRLLLPPRFAALPASVQLRVVQLVQSNPVVTVRGA